MARKYLLLLFVVFAFSLSNAQTVLKKKEVSEKLDRIGSLIRSKNYEKALDMFYSKQLIIKEENVANKDKERYGEYKKILDEIEGEFALNQQIMDDCMAAFYSSNYRDAFKLLSLELTRKNSNKSMRAEHSKLVAQFSKAKQLCDTNKILVTVWSEAYNNQEYEKAYEALTVVNSIESPFYREDVERLIVIQDALANKYKAYMRVRQLTVVEPNRTLDSIDFDNVTFSKAGEYIDLLRAHLADLNSAPLRLEGQNPELAKDVNITKSRVEEALFRLAEVTNEEMILDAEDNTYQYDAYDETADAAAESLYEKNNVETHDEPEGKHEPEFVEYEQEEQAVSYNKPVVRQSNSNNTHNSIKDAELTVVDIERSYTKLTDIDVIQLGYIYTLDVFNYYELVQYNDESKRNAFKETPEYSKKREALIEVKKEAENTLYLVQLNSGKNKDMLTSGGEGGKSPVQCDYSKGGVYVNLGAYNKFDGGLPFVYRNRFEFKSLPVEKFQAFNQYGVLTEEDTFYRQMLFLQMDNNKGKAFMDDLENVKVVALFTIDDVAKREITKYGAMQNKFVISAASVRLVVYNANSGIIFFDAQY